MLALWKKNYDKPRQHIKKQRHYFAGKGLYSQSYGFFQYSCMCDSWTIKKPEHWRIDVFELWYWRRLLRVPWTARGSNQSILKEISPEYWLEGLMLKLNLQLFVHCFVCYYFLPFWRLSFHLAYSFFCCAKLLILIRSHLFIFVFISNILGGGS